MRLVAVLLCILLLSVPSAFAQIPDPAVEVNEKVMPAIVQVLVEIDYKSRPVAYVESRLTGQLIREVGEWSQHQATSTGSGTVIYSGTVRRRGQEETMTLILTNHHVVKDTLAKRNQTLYQYRPEDIEIDNWQMKLRKDAKEEAEVQITGARLGIVVIPDQNFWIPAEVVLYDETLDIALLKVADVEGVPYVRFGDSDATRVGETLYIAGAPLGFPFQLTQGILGQKDFSVPPNWRNMWRYDAAQAPGSSGSGIFNRNGELVGLVRGTLGYSYLVGFGYVFVPQAGQHLGIPANQIKFLLRWQGYGFIFDYDDEDIVDRWTKKKVH